MQAPAGGGGDPRLLTSEQMLAALVRVLQRKPVRRFFIYGLWAELWIERNAAKGLGRSVGFPPGKVALEAAALSQALALRMTIENMSKVETTERGSELVRRVDDAGSASRSPFAPYFEDDVVMSVLTAAPLSVRGGQMSFIHKTVQEFNSASGLLSSIERIFSASGTPALAVLDQMISELSASVRAVDDPPQLAARAQKLLSSTKARPVRKLIEALTSSPLSQLRLAREDGRVIEEQVLDFLVDAMLDDTVLVARLGVLRKLIATPELHGGHLEQVDRNLDTLLTSPLALAKRAQGTMLHQAAKEGNMALLRLARAALPIAMVWRPLGKALSRHAAGEPNPAGQAECGRAALHAC